MNKLENNYIAEVLPKEWELWAQHHSQGVWHQEEEPPKHDFLKGTEDWSQVLHRTGEDRDSTLCCCSVAKSCLTFCDPMDSIPCLSLSPRVCSSSCPLNWWCHPTISFSVTFSFCFWSFTASGSFPVSWLFASGDQSIRALASPSVLLMSIQG